MDDICNKSTDSIGSLNRQMFKDFSDYHKLKEEKESLIRTNAIYLDQVSDMEIKVSDLQALLQAKDSELDKYRKTQDSTDSSKNYSELESRIAWLEEENNSLKEYSSLIGDLTQIKIQLEHATSMKNKFELLYREAKVKLIEYENYTPLFTNNDKLIQEKDELEKQLFNIQLKLRSQEIQLSKANEENRNLKQLVAGREQELYELYNKPEPKANTLPKHNSARDLHQFTPNHKPPTYSRNRSPQQTISPTKRAIPDNPLEEIQFSKTLDSQAFSQGFQHILRSSHQTKSESKDLRTLNISTKLSNCSTTAIKPEKQIAAFVPSIMRVKKLFKSMDIQDKPYIQKHLFHQRTKRSDNSFADEFPDEDELL